MHRRTLAAVEHAVLDAGRIRGARHLAAERIDLTHQMPLGCTADRRVTGHIADRVQIDGEAGGFHAEPGRSERSLDARMSCANHNNVKRFCRETGHTHPPYQKNENRY